MEKNEKMNNKPKYGVGDNRTFHSPQPNKALAAVIYVLFNFLGISLIILGIIAFSTPAAEYKQAQEIIQIKNAADYSKYSIDLISRTKMLYGIGCFIGYLIMFVGVAWFMRDELYVDFEKIKNNKKFYLLMIPLCAIGFCVVVYTFQHFWNMITPESDNQNAIVSVIEYGGAGGVLLMLSTILFAPTIEELIYRKLSFSTLGKWSKVSAYLASITVFALVHMIGQSFDLNWLLNLVAYLVCAAGLTVVFERSKENVFVSIAAHTLNNIIACILVLSKLH